MSKRLSKQIASFCYFILHGISIASFGAATGAPVGVSSAKFNLAFLIFTGIVKKKEVKNNKK